jgi:hypothetical protein|tara:strand:- start:288 stop:659 length:372 start_codon:yes stop_codon:yes gene_type:complete
MGTSAMVGIIKEDGKIHASYVHYDGYVSHTGKMLIEHYNTPETAAQVSEGGYLSALERDYEVSRERSVNSDMMVSFDNKHAFVSQHTGFCTDYVYLFDGETWEYAETYGPMTFNKVVDVSNNV